MNKFQKLLTFAGLLLVGRCAAVVPAGAQEIGRVPHGSGGAAVLYRDRGGKLLWQTGANQPMSQDMLRYFDQVKVEELAKLAGGEPNREPQNHPEERRRSAPPSPRPPELQRALTPQQQAKFEALSVLRTSVEEARQTTLTSFEGLIEDINKAMSVMIGQ